MTNFFKTERKQCMFCFAGGDVEKMEPSHTADGNIKWGWPTVWQFLNRRNNSANTEMPQDPAVLLLGVYSKGLKQMCNKHSWTIHNTKKDETIQMSTEHSKRNVVQPSNGRQVLMHFSTCTNPENILSSEISYTEINTYCMDPSTWSVQQRQIYKVD